MIVVHGTRSIGSLYLVANALAAYVYKPYTRTRLVAVERTCSPYVPLGPRKAISTLLVSFILLAGGSELIDVVSVSEGVTLLSYAECSVCMHASNILSHFSDCRTNLRISRGAPIASATFTTDKTPKHRTKISRPRPRAVRFLHPSRIHFPLLSIQQT